MNIFISENDSKDEVYDKLAHKLDIQNFKEQIGDIFKKANNNYVGYYLFEDNKEFYKVFVLPKHISNLSEDIEDSIIIKQFIDYLEIYYKLKVKYDEYIPSNLNLKSSFELAFDSNKDIVSAQNIEQFIFFKYQSLLVDILNFFDTHMAHKRVKKPFIAQTIKYNLNLARNIKEPNKTKIHQDKIEEIIFSKIATITFEAVKLFSRNKISIIENLELQHSLYQLSSRIKNILQKKYQVDKGLDLTINKLLSSRNLKYFRKKSDSLILYGNLLALFGIENFFDEKENKQIDRSITSEALFIRPEKLYEWIVYDKLREQYKDGYDILKEGLHSGLTKKYKINDESIKSNPDIILKNLKDNSFYVVDAKWKLLNKEIPDVSDILKLKRDTEIRNFETQKIFSLLIYPQANDTLYQEYLTDTLDEPTFKFYSRQIRTIDNEINILADIEEVSLANGNLAKLNQSISEINKTDYDNNPLHIEQVTKDISSYVINHFSEERIFEKYSVVKDFIDNELEKSETMIRLLKSSVSVVYYLDNFVDEQFSDYTLPASSIWKAIENEIKENIRYLIHNIEKNTKGDKVYSDILTLGTYKFVFKNIVNFKDQTGYRGNTYRVFKNVLEELDEDMVSYKSFFEIITDMRNDYTHSEIMNKEKFHEDIIEGIFTKGICSSVMIDDILKLNIEIQKIKTDKS